MKKNNTTTIAATTAEKANETAQTVEIQTSATVPATEDSQTAPIVLSDLNSAELVALLNAEKDKNAHKPILDALREVLKAENKRTLKTDIATFAHTAARDESLFWSTFTTDPFSAMLKLKVDEDAEDGKAYSLVPVNRRILFTQIDNVYQEENHGKSIASQKNYLRMISRITDNLYRSKCEELSEGTEQKVVISAVYQGDKGETKMKDVDFSGTGIGALLKQFQALADTIMPEGQSVPLSRADVRYIIDAMTKANEGKVKIGNEKKMEAAFWVAVSLRKAGKAYVVESAAKCHAEKKPATPKNPDNRTEKQEEVMSKVPNRPESETSNNPKEDSKKDGKKTA